MTSRLAVEQSAALLDGTSVKAQVEEAGLAKAKGGEIAKAASIEA